MHWKDRQARGRVLVLGVIALTAAGLLSGCGGSSTRSTAKLRVADAAVNAGTSSVVINSGTAGNMTYFAVSDYQYIEPQNNVNFTYITSEATPSNVSATTTQASITADNYYTAFLIGRVDLAAIQTGTDSAGKATYKNDPRYLRVVLGTPRVSPPSGQAAVRIVHAAPDFGNLNATFTLSGSASAAATFSNAAFGSIPAFQNVPAGTYTLSASLAAQSAALVAQSVSLPNLQLDAGKAYTLVIAEKLTGTAPALTPTYEIKSVEE